MKTLHKVLCLCALLSCSGSPFGADDTLPRLSPELKVLERELGRWETSRPAPPNGYFGVIFEGPDEERDAGTIRSVSPEGPAFAAGLRPGDVLLEVDGKPAKDQRAFRDSRPGDTVKIKFARNGQNKETTVKLGAFPEKMVQVLEPDQRGQSVLLREPGSGMIYHDPESGKIVRLWIAGAGVVLKSAESRENLERNEYVRKVEATLADGRKGNHTLHVKWTSRDERSEWMTDRVVDGESVPDSPVRIYKRVK